MTKRHETEQQSFGLFRNVRNALESESESESEKGNVLSLPSVEKGHQPKIRKRRYSEKVREQQRSLLEQLADAAVNKNLPSLDRMLKSMVTSAIGDLLKGGYAFELVRSQAMAALLDWDPKRNYSKLTQLRARVRVEAARVESEAHQERKREETRRNDAGQIHRDMIDVRDEMLALGKDTSFMDQIIAKRRTIKHTPTANARGVCTFCGERIKDHR